MHIEVDASDAPQRILHVRQTIPVGPGPVTLVFPKWLPGEHGPTGPINDLVNLHMRARGKPVAWQRAPRDAYAFVVPSTEGADALDVSFDAVTSVGGRGAPSPASATPELLVLKWNAVLLYESGVAVSEARVEASLRLPPGWSWGSALIARSESPTRLRFAPVSLETLIDSPVVAGAETTRFDLSPPGGPPHKLFAAADSARALALPPETLAGYRALVREAGALFGTYPYESYTFLLTLSDHLPFGGLEHHASSDNRVAEDTWLDPHKRLFRSALLPHELVHSWNGKYRRPQGLVVRDYQQAHDTRLLWVYEGLTSYWGEVLAARAGLRTREQAQEFLAMTAAGMDAQTGRTWRSLADTAATAPHLGQAVKHWRNLRRGLDYYPEMVLVWLEADGLVRQATQGARTLDDFCRRFAGPSGDRVRVSPYERNDVLELLREVAPLDWDAFFTSRIEAIVAQPSRTALGNVGWRLVFTREPTETFRALEAASRELNLTYSLGLVVSHEGEVVDVVPGTAAARARVPPGARVVAVNGRKFSRERLLAAVEDSPRRRKVELLLENQEFFEAHELVYAGGPRYPRLERLEHAPDLLGSILTARAPSSQAKPPTPPIGD